MSLPISRSQLDRLGERLVSSEPPSDPDLALLGQVLAAYDITLRIAQNLLAQRGYLVSARLKSSETLIDKLRRERSMKLKSVQDVAGARIVTDGTRVGQDETVAEVVRIFSDGAKAPRTIDRRDSPSSGYRAVHVIVHCGAVPVEVQARTRLQHRWAQTFERIADNWGRGIRYGGLPDDPERDVRIGSSRITRAGLVDLLHGYSAQIDTVESAQVELSTLRTALELARADGALPDQDEYHAIWGEVEELENQVDRRVSLIHRALVSMARLAEH